MTSLDRSGHTNGLSQNTIEVDWSESKNKILGQRIIEAKMQENDIISTPKQALKHIPP